MAKQFRFEEGLCKSAAVDGEKSSLPARAFLVKRAGDQFLPASRFTHDQNDGIGVGYSPDHLIDFDHALAAAHKALKLIDFHFFERSFLDRAHRECFPYEIAQLFDLERLTNIVVRSLLDGFNCGAGRTERRHQNNDRLRLLLSKPLQDLKPICIGHSKVRQDQVEFLVSPLAHCGLSAVYDGDAVALFSEGLLDHVRSNRVVIHY